MLSGSPFLPDACEADDALTAGEPAVGARLVACVANAFPELALGNSRIECTGGDHVLLIVDDAYAFRFPRAGMHDLALEIAVLKSLKRRLTLATPNYDYIDPDGRFAGYRLIEGVALTQRRFAGLENPAQDQVLADAAHFLRDLHALSTHAVAWPGAWPRAWTTAEFARRGEADRLPVIAAHAPHLARPIQRFYARYRSERTGDAVILHGDLVAEHILLDPHRSRLAGIIDFGDVALGDPAQDLLGFWIYGAAAVSKLIASYDASGAHPGLLDRSRNHFIRYRIDRLFETLTEGADARPDIAEVGKLLGHMPASNETTPRR